MSARIPVVAALAAATVVAGGLFIELGRSGGSSHAPSAVPAQLPGELERPPPWPRNGSQLEQRLAALGLPALRFEGTALHIHEHLDVFVGGKRVVVPAGIGIDPAGRFISPLHTHDTTGVVHVESPTIRPFTLGEFFGVWGVPLGRSPRVFIDGRPLSGDPGRLVLRLHQEIVVAFGRLPRRVPARYDFPSGL